MVPVAPPVASSPPLEINQLKNKRDGRFLSISLLSNDGLVTDSSYKSHPTLTGMINHKQVWRQITLDWPCSSGFIQHQLSHPLVTCQHGSLTTDYPVHQDLILTSAIAICIWWYLWSVVLLLLCQASECSEQPVQLAFIAGLDAHSQSPPCWRYLGRAYRKSPCHSIQPCSILNYAQVSCWCAFQVVTGGQQ